MASPNYMQNLEIDKCIQQLSEGSRKAFTQLYLAYSDQLYGYALKLTKSPSLAEDVVQETFIRIWEGRENIRSGTAFKSYLFQISYHLMIDVFRTQIELVDFENFVASSAYQTENEGEGLLNYDDYQRLLSLSLARFTPKQQEIFKLSREEGLSAKEIAKQMDISEKTVNNQLSIVLSGLKKDLLLGLFLLYFIQ